MSNDKIEKVGEVTEHLSGKHYLVDVNGNEVKGYLSGKMRKYNIDVRPPDEVTIEISTYDPTRGRITKRH